MSQRYWLFKSEPNTYSFADLERDGSTMWDGVRNYQARNFMRDEVQEGDGVLFYHSVVKPMAVVGLAKVVREAYPDPTQFERKSPYFDAKATAEAPRWVLVDIAYDRALPTPVTLERIKGEKQLADMPLINRSRLSIQPVTAAQWRQIVKLGGLA